MGEESMNAVENVDAILSQALEPRAPMEAASENAEAKEQPQEAPTVEETPKDPGRMLKYKGKEISIDDEKYQMLAQKGYSYEQAMHQLKVDRKLWEREREKQRQQFDSEYSELKQINDFAKSNPAFEQLIQREWAKIQQGQGPTVENQAANLPPAVQNQLSQILERLNAQDEEQQNRAMAEKEAKLETAIEQYKEKYKDYDWSNKDDFGQTLEDRITDFALDNGIKDFTIAANAFLMDEHLKRTELQAKEKVAREIQEQNKLGLGKITDKSQLQVKKPDDIKNKSYNALVQEALAELGL